MVSAGNPAGLYRPQPYGIGPLPGALLLVPPPAGPAEAVAQQYLRTGGAPPPFWEVLWLVAQGRTADALAVLEADPSPLATYNRFVLAPAPDAYRVLRAMAEPLPTLAALVAYACGLDDAPPSVDALDGELLAQGLVIRAAWHLEQGREADALDALRGAVAAAEPVSPLVAAAALGQAAAIERTRPGGAAAAVAGYRRAIALAGSEGPDGLVADLWIALGEALHEQAEGRRELLLEAIRCYQAALRRELGPEREPLLFARAHHLLALAYLAIPPGQPSDQLRQGMAVQSLRAALAVYTREQFPEQWAQTQMHLANALVYLPSAAPIDHLTQAVELYEALLDVRRKSLDPVGYARVLANQATALAHLGLFAPAVEKLSEAHKLFHWHGEAELAAAMLEELDRIAVRRAELATSV